jgi:hypothetical protein
MQFKFIGTEPSEFFGFHWYPGVVHDVTDAHAIGKLSNSVLFEKFETAVSTVPVVETEAEPVEPEQKEPFDDYVQQPRRRGRPPKVNDGNQN